MTANLFTRWIKKTLGQRTSKGPTHRGGRGRRCTFRLFRPFLEVLETRDLFAVNPFVESINLANPASQLTNASSVNYTVSFNEPVTGVTTAAFQLAETGGVTAAVSQVTPV